MIQGTLPFSFFGLSLTTVYGCALQVEPQTPHCKKKAIKSIHSVSILSSFSFPRVSTLGNKGRHGKQATFSLFFVFLFHSPGLGMEREQAVSLPLPSLSARASSSSLPPQFIPAGDPSSNWGTGGKQSKEAESTEELWCWH